MISIEENSRLEDAVAEALERAGLADIENFDFRRGTVEELEARLAGAKRLRRGS